MYSNCANKRFILRWIYLLHDGIFASIIFYLPLWYTHNNNRYKILSNRGNVLENVPQLHTVYCIIEWISSCGYGCFVECANNQHTHTHAQRGALEHVLFARALSVVFVRVHQHRRYDTEMCRSWTDYCMYSIVHTIRHWVAKMHSSDQIYNAIKRQSSGHSHGEYMYHKWNTTKCFVLWTVSHIQIKINWKEYSLQDKFVVQL